MAARKYTKELLEPLVAQSASVAGVLRLLGLRPNGGAHAHISRTIKLFEIDNLRFLCPNCHRLTPNFAGRGRGRFSVDTLPPEPDEPSA